MAFVSCGMLLGSLLLKIILLQPTQGKQPPVHFPKLRSMHT